MHCKFNKFKKKSESETAFVLTEGKPIFSETIYILNPKYIRKNCPDFTLVSNGKHISGLFKIAENWYSGDYQKKGLIVFFNLDAMQIDLFQTDLNRYKVQQLLVNGKLSKILYEARQEGTG